MARLALFYVISVTLAVMLCGVAADSSDADSDRYAPEEDPSDRAASASAHASAQAQGYGGPHPYTRFPPLPTLVPRPGNSVRCVTCSNCADVKNSTLSKVCPYSPDPLKNGRCVVFSEKYYHMKQPFVIRGCMSERGSCAEIRSAVDSQKELMKVVACRECQGDLCNGVGQFTPNLMTALLALFVTPMLMKYTLS